jgi:hypothetical protein
MESDLMRKPIPEYLRHYWIAKKAETRNLIVREKELYRLVVNDVRGKQKATLDLLEDLEKSALDYVKIGDYDLWPDVNEYGQALRESIDELQLFRVTQCNPLLLNVIQVFSTPKDVVKVFRIVANFSFRYFIIGGQSPGNLEREMNGIAVSVRSRELTSPKDVADSFRAINPDPNFRSDFKLAKMLRARAKIARYMLAKISNHMSLQSSQYTGEQLVDPNSKAITLEHVLPQSVPASWHPHFSPGVVPEDYVDRIGNLTLLRTKLNAAAADAPFQDKVQLALSVSDLPINQEFNTITNWGEIEIEQRQEKMAKLAVQIWRLEG